MSSMSDVVDLITKEAIIIHEEDVSLNRRMAGSRTTLFEGQKNISYSNPFNNAGALATRWSRCLLGVVRKLHENGQLERVYADETRDHYCQGASSLLI